MLLFSISVFTEQSQSEGVLTGRFTLDLQSHIRSAEEKFSDFVADKGLITKLAAANNDGNYFGPVSPSEPFYFIYSSGYGFPQLTFWNTQTILPDTAFILNAEATAFKKEVNGYYFLQKKIRGHLIIISMLPVKWEYAVKNDFLFDNFVADPRSGKKFSISLQNVRPAVYTKQGRYLFSAVLTSPFSNGYSDTVTAWLRIIALIPLLLFIHFASVHIFFRSGILKATVFLVIILTLLRVLSYLFPFPVNIRRFELFDPAVYGSDNILRSLGDLLVNTLLVLWVLNFIRKRPGIIRVKVNFGNSPRGKFVFGAIVGILLTVTYIAGNTVRSLVADSQISFDVINFFSLNIYSVVGFLVLSCITISYYYFCRIVLHFLKMMFPDYSPGLYLWVAVGGLFFLLLRADSPSSVSELWELGWLLLFLWIIRNDPPGFFSTGLIVPGIIFRLFFFSASLAAVIISENNQKELLNRRHIAERIVAQNFPERDVVLNNMMAQFTLEKPPVNFALFDSVATNIPYRNRLIRNYFNGFLDRFKIEMLVFDRNRNPLFNEDSIEYAQINNLVYNKSKPALAHGLYYYAPGYNGINFIIPKTVRNTNKEVLGEIFFLVSSIKKENNNFNSRIFSSGNPSSDDISPSYAYAVYEKKKLLFSRNDHTFSSRYPEKKFGTDVFISENNGTYNELWFNAGGDTYVVVVKENRLLVELFTLLSYLFCAFIAGSVISYFISLLLRARLNIYRIRQEIQLNIRQQIHGTIIFFSLISFIIIGLATILFFISRFEKSNKETLSHSAGIIQQELKDIVITQMNDTVNPTLFSQSSLYFAVNNLARVHAKDINIYDTSGMLTASSLSWPYDSGVLGRQIDPVAYSFLHGKGEVQYYQKEKMGDLNFASKYLTITDSTGVGVAYLHIPFFASQVKLKEEISDFLITIINLNAFIFLIGGIIALIITNRITGAFAVISEKMKKINLGKSNEVIVRDKNDEIGLLVKEYNRMVAKLDASVAALARTERESAWQEMAKQIAHEIKNPLTPMKLSMQYLQRSIEKNDPGIRELGAKVSATLIEQIDHLNNIANDFSRFANIENAHPEIFDVKEALLSVKQLYEGNNDIQFKWNLLPGAVMITADKTHVNRILTNLILNGIQAVPAGITPALEVSETIFGKNVQIKISDNGTGISKAIQENIFMPNFTTKTSGTGLGLAMCLRMARRAGGDIRYETSESGTAFFVTFPLTPFISG